MRKKKNASDDDATIHNAAEWICFYLVEYYEPEFCKVALKNDLVGQQKMIKEAAAAMWSEGNVPMIVARIILQHLRIAFGHTLSKFLRKHSTLSLKISWKFQDLNLDHSCTIKMNNWPFKIVMRDHVMMT